MFIRWQKRIKGLAWPWGWRGTDTHWAAILVESLRIDGKPTQKHIAYLGGIIESAIEHPANRAASGRGPCSDSTNWLTWC